MARKKKLDHDKLIGDLANHVGFLTIKHGSFQFDVGFNTCIALISLLQLSLRHPLNNGPTAENGRQFIDDLIVTLDKASPGIGAILRLGDNPEHDFIVDASQQGGDHESR